MIHPMHFPMPTDEEIHAVFEQGEAAVMAVFHAVATQVAALAQQLAKQGAGLQELQARLAKSSANSGKPPSSDGYGTVKRSTSLRKAGDKSNGGQPGHEGQTLMAVEPPERIVTHEVPRCGHCQASFHDIEAVGYDQYARPLYRTNVHVCYAQAISCTRSLRESQYMRIGWQGYRDEDSSGCHRSSLHNILGSISPDA
jgi:hypothetical protein